ncbi:MAG: hypothetical protein RMY34_26935 [Aulosira sp. DedQUE10]|nr:hypothetical protein [Aulosira sp. DedQUE10]
MIALIRFKVKQHNATTTISCPKREPMFDQDEFRNAYSSLIAIALDLSFLFCC